ncbi:MAG: FecR domain-containing protein [Polyangiaceae bacterium]|nr:FecR domain-containing protein [Polyangiaceae bacterium]
MRQRLLARSPEAWPRLSWGLLPMAAALAALLVFFVLSATRPAPLSFTVGSGAVAGAPGDWLGSDEVETPLRFTDGTVVTVAPAGRARVTETTPEGASVMLERGSLEADVVHTGSSKWRFLAGPFEVAVTGTRFTASWDPGAERLDVTMSSGSVLVTGPVLGSARAVRAGERLSVWLRDQRMSLETIGAEVEAAVVPTSATSQTSDPVIDPPATPATSVATVRRSGAQAQRGCGLLEQLVSAQTSLVDARPRGQAPGGHGRAR